MEEKERKGGAKDVMKKSPALYVTMLIVWTVLTAFLWYNFSPNFVRVPFVKGVKASMLLRIGARLLLIFNAIFISYFWLNGVVLFVPPPFIP